MYGRKGSDDAPANQNSLGGESISIENAMVNKMSLAIKTRLEIQKLKTICWGGAKSIIKPDWSKAGLVFHEPKSIQSYGLNVGKGSCKTFLLVLQVEISCPKFELI